jgi:uncharacterized protein
MEPRLSAVTLATKDLARSRRFYEALGWQAGFAADDIAFYQAGGAVLILWEAQAFTGETGLAAKPGGIGVPAVEPGVPAPEADGDLGALEQP